MLFRTGFVSSISDRNCHKLETLVLKRQPDNLRQREIVETEEGVTRAFVIHVHISHMNEDHDDVRIYISIYIYKMCAYIYAYVCIYICVCVCGHIIYSYL